ncbi:MAG: sigma-70 family RNA polymerase sigma factor [Armatimonadota bacterium]|nr:sigma-70 family RNA polymerase sigma factor [bacterium]
MERTDAELIRQCLNGDNLGFDGLVRRYQKPITGFCYRILGNTDLAADAAQEAFVKAYYALESFKMDAPFLSWLFRIASNTCIDMTRKQARRRVDSLDENPESAQRLPSGEPSPECVAIKSESGRLLQKAILSLPVGYRTLVVLFHYQGMKIREIAELLNKPEGTVKHGLHAAREMLRRKLQGVIIEI